MDTDNILMHIHQERSSLSQLQILNRIRLIAINGQIALILFAIWYLQIKLPLNWLLLIITVEIGFQIYSFKLAKRQSVTSSFTLLIHLTIDSLILAAIVYFTGGTNNPFIYLLLLSIALGTMMLRPRQLIALCGLQLLIYSLLNDYHRPLELTSASPLNSYHMHMAGMWVNFVLTVILIGVFGFLTRRILLQQEKKIQQLHEKQLKDEQLLSLGIMSAGAAHELGTPLSTMSVIVDDLKHADLANEYQDDLNILGKQIDASQKIIQSLADKSRKVKGQLLSEKQKFEPLKVVLTQLFENWLVYRPQIKLTLNRDNRLTELSYSLPISVEQAITNLLDNAADAGLENNSDTVSASCYLEDSQIVIEILDNGPGITEAMQSEAGSRLMQTEKSDGLGWGLFLSNASIERMGGHVALANRTEGGTSTKIVLPYSPILDRVDNQK